MGVIYVVLIFIFEYKIFRKAVDLIIASKNDENVKNGSDVF